MTAMVLPFARNTPATWVVGAAVVAFVAGGAASLGRFDALEALLIALFCAVLAAAAVVDLRERRIPNALTYPGTAVALVLALAAGSLADAGGGLLIAGSVMGLFWVIGRGQLGLGDVKLSAFAGAALGWEGALTYLAVGVAVGAVAALVVLVVRRDRRATMAYGPWLAVGAAVAAGVHGLAVA